MDLKHCKKLFKNLKKKQVGKEFLRKNLNPDCNRCTVQPIGLHCILYKSRVQEKVSREIESVRDTALYELCTVEM